MDSKEEAKRKKVASKISGTASGEPLVTQESYREDLLRALNWYTVNKEEDEYRLFARSFFEKDAKLKKFVGVTSRAPFNEIKPVAVVSRLISRNQYISDADKERNQARIATLIKKYGKVKDETDEVPSTTKPVVSIQERTENLAREHYSHIQSVIDLASQDASMKFSMKSYILSKKISTAVSKKIATMLTKTINELSAAVDGDKELIEGYSQFSKVQLRKFKEFVEGIAIDCGANVKVRKPRKIKQKSAEQITSKAKYQKTCSVLGITSLSPDSVVGASTVWLYNTQYRKLIQLHAAQGTKLSIKGTTITGVNEELALSRTLRKPEEFFKQLPKRTTVALRRSWESLKTTVSSAASRLNESTIILALS
jgi:hypothetical protein